MQKRYSPGAQVVLEALQGARIGAEEYVRLDRALQVVMNLSPARSALSRALQEDAIWESGMRRQFFQFASGDRQYEYLRPQGSRVGVRIATLLEEAENWAAQDKAAQISEAHLAKALLRSPDAVGSLGINAVNLVARVAALEGATVEALCFVLMPFRAELADVYQTSIKPAVEKAGLRCERADEIAAPGVVLDQIDDRILRAQVLVADLTDSNPNVTQEVGYARAFGKPLVFITQQLAHLPFDVRHYRVIEYRLDQLGLVELRDRLHGVLTEVLG